MNCKKVLSRLQAYADGEMPATLMRQMKEHLNLCPACCHQFERIRHVEDMLDGLTVPPLPDEFAVRVMAEARRMAPVPKEKRAFFPLKRQPLRWLLDLSVPMRLAACSLVLLACLLGLFMSRELSLSGNRQASAVETENMDGIEWFGPTPPASLSSAYMTLALTATDERSVSR
jgi:anti-sigma factor RsiW